MKPVMTIVLLLAMPAIASAGPNMKDHPFAGDLSPNEVQVVDMDNDGDLDIFGVTETLMWLENTDKKAGKLVARQIAKKADCGESDVMVGDIDGDKDQDIVCGAGLHFWENKGGAKKWEKHEVDAEYYSKALGILDADNDGDMDIVAGDFRGGGGLKWFSNEDGKGKKWSEAKVFFAHGDIPYRMEQGDFDGDKDIDLVANFGNKLIVLTNPGKKDAPFKATNLAEIEVRQLVLVDIDGDGDTDLVTPDEGQVIIWLNDGAGRFAKHASELRWNLVIQAAVGDFDGDGDLDILGASGNEYDGIAFFENEGGLKFKKAKQWRPHWSSRSFIAADLDGDTDKDVVAISWDTSAAAVWAGWFENTTKGGGVKKK
jgi:hypothetical protein